MIVRRFTRWLFSRPWFARPIEQRLRRLVSTESPDYWIGDTTETGQPVFYHYRLFRLLGWEVSIHQILRGDPAGHFHTHPSNHWRMILSGGYVEEELKLLPCERLPALTHLLPWHPGDFGRIRPEMCHRFESVKRDTFSLWISGPRRAEINIVNLGPDKRYQSISETTENTNAENS